MLLEEDKRGILLESGTNEIEVMEFTINESLYGINVAKVKEILVSQPVKHMPHAHPAVEGIFKPRDKVITVVDLPTYLLGETGEKKSKDLFIITNFNKMNIAFRVHTVVGISRISWKSIQKPDKTVAGGNEGIATGIAQCGEDLVTILDFEKIVAEIAPETTIQMSGRAPAQRRGYFGGGGLRAPQQDDRRGPAQVRLREYPDVPGRQQAVGVPQQPPGPRQL